MRKAIAILVLLVIGVVTAQNLGETIRGLYGDSLGMAITTNIPGYGVHAVVHLITVDLAPEAARDVAVPVFNAIATQIGTTVSVSVFSKISFGTPEYELVLQRIDGVTHVFLNGEPFDP